MRSTTNRSLTIDLAASLPAFARRSQSTGIDLASWLRDQRAARAPQYIGGKIEVDCRTSASAFRGPFTIGFKEAADPLPDVLLCPGCGKPWTVLAVSRG